MLPLVLVFLFAQSALSLPYVDVDLYSIDNSPVIPDNGRLVNRNTTLGALECIDGGDSTLYYQILHVTVVDMSEINEVLAAAQSLVMVGESAPGVPGDACAAANLINVYVNDRSRLRSALANFVQTIVRYIDIIVQLIVNPNSVRFSSGSRGNCLGGGRTYQFEDIWDIILRDCNVRESDLLNEQYCAAKRLYTAWNVRSNNIAAAVSAATIPQVREVVSLSIREVATFLRSLAYNQDPTRPAAAAKAALLRAVNQVKCY